MNRSICWGCTPGTTAPLTDMLLRTTGCNNIKVYTDEDPREWVRFGKYEMRRMDKDLIQAGAVIRALVKWWDGMGRQRRLIYGEATENVRTVSPTARAGMIPACRKDNGRSNGSGYGVRCSPRKNRESESNGLADAFRFPVLRSFPSGVKGKHHANTLPANNRQTVPPLKTGMFPVNTAGIFNILHRQSLMPYYREIRSRIFIFIGFIPIFV